MHPHEEHSGHWGSYDAVDHEYDNRSRHNLASLGAVRTRSPITSRFAPLQLPAQYPANIGNFINDALLDGGIYVMNDASAQALIASLALTDFVAGDAAAQGIVAAGAVAGTAVLAQQLGNAWVQNALASGQGVLVGAQVIQGAEFAVVSNAVQLAANATPNSAYQGVVIAAPPLMLQQAQQLLAQPGPQPLPPAAPLPPGGAIDEPYGPAPTTAGGVPSWAIVAGLAVAALGVSYWAMKAT